MGAGGVSRQSHDVTLWFPKQPGYMLILDSTLQHHICDIWRIGHCWNQWRMAAHVIGAAHDLYYAAGMAARSPLLQDLEFLRQVAETRHMMSRKRMLERQKGHAVVSYSTGDAG